MSPSRIAYGKIARGGGRCATSEDSPPGVAARDVECLAGAASIGSSDKAWAATRQTRSASTIAAAVVSARASEEGEGPTAVLVRSNKLKRNRIAGRCKCKIREERNGLFLTLTSPLYP